MTCKNCGSYVDNNAKFCNACGAPVSPKKKKKKKAPIFISIILVLALIAGGVYLAFMNIPGVKVYSALKNTLFNSSEYEIEFKITEDGNKDEFTKANITLTLGDDIDSSVLDMSVVEQWMGYSYDEYNYYSEPSLQTYKQNISVKNGKIYVDDEQNGDLNEIFTSLEEELGYYTDKNVDIEEEINNLINGKLDEKALETLYNETVAPIIEEIIKESTGESVELPEYKYVMGNSGTLSDLFKNKDVQNALALEKIKSNLPGTTYEYSIDMGSLSEAVLNYAMEDEQYMSYLETVADRCDYDDVDDLVDEINEDFNDYENINGTITIKSNRITHITIELDGAEIEIAINSIK